MGTVMKDYVHFCPVEDEVTVEAIVEQIMFAMKVEQHIRAHMVSEEEEW